MNKYILYLIFNHNIYTGLDWTGFLIEKILEVSIEGFWNKCESSFFKTGKCKQGNCKTDFVFRHTLSYKCLGVNSWSQQVGAKSPAIVVLNLHIDFLVGILLIRFQPCRKTG